MAESAGHTDAVRTNKLLIVVIVWIGVIAYRIPSPSSRLVELRIRKESKTHDTGADSIVRANRHILASCSELYAWILGLIFKRIGWTILAASIQPETIVLRIRACTFLEAGLVYESEIGPPIVPVAFE